MHIPSAGACKLSALTHGVNAGGRNCAALARPRHCFCQCSEPFLHCAAEGRMSETKKRKSVAPLEQQSPQKKQKTGVPSPDRFGPGSDVARAEPAPADGGGSSGSTSATISDNDLAGTADSDLSRALSRNSYGASTYWNQRYAKSKPAALHDWYCELNAPLLALLKPTNHAVAPGLRQFATWGSPVHCRV
jgi:hypothetical protein